jgi:Fe-S oxidoreductase
LIGGRISEEEIWACTTCRACQEHCPVDIEHIQKLVDLRRYLVLSESRFPQELNAPYRSLENSGCPWAIPASERGTWAEGLGVRTLAEAGTAEYLWWVGCAVDVDERNKKVARALARVLQAGGVDFAILGAEEQCCGDPARRTGNEYLFQMLAQTNVELLNGYGVKKILVHCPHCFNTLKNEYPQFAGQFEVVSSSQLIADLLRQGKLKPAAKELGAVAYHDPCYLGRHNGIYEAPRRLLASAGAQVAELECARADSFCCGGGGGRSWLEERLGQRINQVRAQHALNTGAETVAVACPYCLSMLINGVKDLGAEERLRVVDYVEVLAEALPTAAE